MKKKDKYRFMPNVKFKIPVEHIKLFNFGIAYPAYALTSDDGDRLSTVCTEDERSFFTHSCNRLVSIYEAMPELIPDGMRYNKELDKLVPDAISASNEYCSGIKVEFEKVVDYTEENISCKNEKSKHYEIWKDFEAIDVLKNCLKKEEYIGFLKGNILKYQLRLGKKDDVQKEVQKILDYTN
jgi:hypothetical protein